MKKLFTNERLIIVILIILLGVGINFHFNQRAKDGKKYEEQVKLTEALTDSIRVYQTKEGEWVAEKRTLQGDLNDLLDENSGLSDSQRELLNTVNRINKERKKDREVFAAAQIKFEKLIDSLNVVIAGASEVDTVNNIISFVETDSSANFIYDLDVLGIRPYPDTSHPEIRFNQIDFPNTQTVTFNFDKNKRKDYPVSFSVMNTNPYYKTYNIESYAIQGVDKDNINPTTGKKIWNWIKVNGKYILVGAAGFAVGAVASGN